MLGRLYENDIGVLRIPLLTGVVDGTTVTSVTLRVKRPSGALSTWSVDIDSATTTQLNLSHELAPTDLDEVGTYVLRAWLYAGADLLGITAVSKDLIVLTAEVPLTDPT